MPANNNHMNKIEVFESYEYVYLLQTPELRNTKIFKFGKTTNLINHYKGYPHDTVIYYVCRVSNCHHVESEIKRLFDQQFVPAKTYGREYYKGDIKSMIRIIDLIINNLDVEINDDEDMEKFLKRCYKTYIKVCIDDEAIDNYIKQQSYNNDLESEVDTVDDSASKFTEDELSNISSDIEDSESDDDEDSEEVINHNRKNVFVCDDCEKQLAAKNNLRKEKVLHDEGEKLREKLHLLERMGKNLAENAKLLEKNNDSKESYQIDEVINLIISKINVILVY